MAKLRNPRPTTEPVPGFTVSFSDSEPARAQKICVALTRLMLEENLKSRGNVAASTTDFLSRQLEDAKSDLDAQDAKLAAFKRQYHGAVAGRYREQHAHADVAEHATGREHPDLNRAQQDKTYAESMLAQQLAAWKSSLSATNPQTLEQQLTVLQSQLLQLQARYTDDYPDVVKTKADIAKIQRELDEINSAASSITRARPARRRARASRPRFGSRPQIHQYQQFIDQSTAIRRSSRRNQRLPDGRR